MAQVTGLGAREKQSLLRREPWCPLDARRAREAQVGAERVAHRVDEALRRGAARNRPPTRGRAPPPGHQRGRCAARSGRRGGRRRASAARTSRTAAWRAGGRDPRRTRSRTGTRAEDDPTPLDRTATGRRQRAAARADPPGARLRPRARTASHVRPRLRGRRAHRLRSAPRAAPFAPETPETSDPASRGRDRRRCLRLLRSREGRGRGNERASGGGTAPRSGPPSQGSRPAAVARGGRSSGGCRRGGRARARRSAGTPRAPRERCSPAFRTSRSCRPDGARSRVRTAAPRPGSARARAEATSGFSSRVRCQV